MKITNPRSGISTLEYSTVSLENHVDREPMYAMLIGYLRFSVFIPCSQNEDDG
jgi:hypothetical protein